MNVSDNIRAVRTKKGLSQAEMARRYGTSPEFYHRLEKKDKTLTLEQVEKIADALGVTVAELLDIALEPKIDALRVEQLEKENLRQLEEIKSNQKKIEEYEGRLLDKDLIIKYTRKEIATVENLFKANIAYIYDNIKHDQHVGTLYYTNANGDEKYIAYNSLSKEEADKLFDFDNIEVVLNEDEEKYIIDEMFNNPKYAELVAFLVSSGFIDDEKILQAYKAKYPNFSSSLSFAYHNHLMLSGRKIVEIMSKND